MSYKFIFPVWGQTYTSLLTTYALPSLLASENLPEWPFCQNSSIVIYTTPEDWHSIKNDKVYLLLKRHVNIEWVPLEVPWETMEKEVAAKYHLAGHVYRRAIAAAQKTRSSLLFLVPDGLITNGSLKFLGQLIQEGKEVVMTIGMRVQLERFVEESEQFIEKGTLELSTKQCLKFMEDNLHSMVLHQFWDNQPFSTHPSNLFSRYNGGILSRAFHLHPLFIKQPVPLENLKNPTIDAGYLQNYFAQKESIHIVDNTDFVIFTLQSVQENPIQGHSTSNIERLAILEKFSSTRCTPIHHWFFEHQLFFHATLSNEDLDFSIQKVKQLYIDQDYDKLLTLWEQGSYQELQAVFCHYYIASSLYLKQNWEKLLEFIQLFKDSLFNCQFQLSPYISRQTNLTANEEKEQTFNIKEIESNHYSILLLEGEQAFALNPSLFNDLTLIIGDSQSEYQINQIETFAMQNPQKDIIFIDDEALSQNEYLECLSKCTSLHLTSATPTFKDHVIFALKQDKVVFIDKISLKQSELKASRIFQDICSQIPSDSKDILLISKHKEEVQAHLQKFYSQLKIKLIEDLSQLQLISNDSFDTVIIYYGLIDNLVNWEQFTQVFDYLKLNGTLIFNAENPQNIFRLRQLLEGNWDYIYKDNSDLNLIPLPAWYVKIEALGHKIQSIQLPTNYELLQELEKFNFVVNKIQVHITQKEHRQIWASEQFIIRCQKQNNPIKTMISEHSEANIDTLAEILSETTEEVILFDRVPEESLSFLKLESEQREFLILQNNQLSKLFSSEPITMKNYFHKIDKVIGIDTLASTSNPWSKLRLYAQLLKPDGQMILSYENAQNWKILNHYIQAQHPWYPPQWKKLIPRMSLARLLSRNGFVSDYFTIQSFDLDQTVIANENILLDFRSLLPEERHQFRINQCIIRNIRVSPNYDNYQTNILIHSEQQLIELSQEKNIDQMQFILLTNLPINAPPKNLRQIDIEQYNVFEYILELWNEHPDKHILWIPQKTYIPPLFLERFFSTLAKNQLHLGIPKVIKKMKDKQTMDEHSDWLAWKLSPLQNIESLNSTALFIHQQLKPIFSSLSPQITLLEQFQILVKKAQQKQFKIAQINQAILYQ